MMREIDEATAKKSIKDIVESMNFKASNYVFLDNVFVTQEILVYSDDRIVTFFVKRNKKNELKKYYHKKCSFVFVNVPFYDLIVSRIVMNEYKIRDIEYIEFLDDKCKLVFFDISGKHSFRVSKTDIFGFSQSNQIEHLKYYISKISKEV